MKNLLFVIVLFFMLACESEKPNFIVQGRVEGLKKGKIFLQKWKDSTVVNLDSVTLYNNNQFVFQHNLDHPEIMYLQLQKDTLDPVEHYFSFFADKGNLNINARLDQFIFAEIEADYENQKQYGTYVKFMRKFNDQKLEMIKTEMIARKSENNQKLDSVNRAYNKIDRRRLLYAVNFAMANPSLEVSPYIALEQSQNISKPYLDTIYQKLDKDIQNSFYGQKLFEFLNQEKN